MMATAGLEAGKLAAKVKILARKRTMQGPSNIKSEVSDRMVATAGLGNTCGGHREQEHL
jgi:hypothetical protein